MRWLVGWSGAPAALGQDGHPTLHPVGARRLWQGPDPLWAVGDWRDDEIRVVTLPRPTRATYLPDPDPDDDGTARLALLGRCPVSDDQLRGALVRAAAGAITHLTSWPGSYTLVVRTGRRTAVVGDLAGARPVFHASWSGGTAFATAGLPLADLLESELDLGHLAARLACPESPEVLAPTSGYRSGSSIGSGSSGSGNRTRPGLTTPYRGVYRVPPGHALVIRDGAADVPAFETSGSWVGGPPPEATEQLAVEGLRSALTDAVRSRTSAPAPGGATARTAADLSGGSASATLALLAAGRGVRDSPLLAVTYTDTAVDGGPGREREIELARSMAADPRLQHVVVPGGAEALPFARLEDIPLTDEPAPVLIRAMRERHRLDAVLAEGGEDLLTGHGARSALDGHPARLVDLYLDHRRRPLLKPLGALARAQGQAANRAALWRSVRQLAHTPYRHGLEDTAAQLAQGHFDPLTGAGRRAAARAFAQNSFAWCVPGPAARWLVGEVLTDIAGTLDHAARIPDPPTRPGRRRSWLALNRSAAEYRVLEQATEITGQRLHAPYLDNQVVRACREVPQTTRVQPGARPRLLHEVLAGAGVRSLPEGLGQAARPDTVPAARLGLRTAAGELQDMFAGSILEKAGLIDPRPIRRLLQSAADGETVPLDGLPELIATEIWLRRLLARRGSCWTGSGVPKRMALTAF